MVCKVTVSPTALQELSDIVGYLSEVSVPAAKTFMASFTEVLDNIGSELVEYRMARIPKLASQGYRTALFDRYVLLYKKEDDVAYIAHVFHQSRNYAKLV